MLSNTYTYLCTGHCGEHTQHANTYQGSFILCYQHLLSILQSSFQLRMYREWRQQYQYWRVYTTIQTVTQCSDLWLQLCQQHIQDQLLVQAATPLLTKGRQLNRLVDGKTNKADNMQSLHTYEWATASLAKCIYVQACHAKFGPPQNGPPWNQNSNQIGSPRNQFGCCNWPPLTVLVPPSLNYSTCMYMTV